MMYDVYNNGMIDAMWYDGGVYNGTISWFHQEK
jgi:hypothetical protein